MATFPADDLKTKAYDAFVAKTTDTLLADPRMVANLIYEHWTTHPRTVGPLIAMVANGSDYLAVGAREQLHELAQHLAESEACRRWHAGERLIGGEA